MNKKELAHRVANYSNLNITQAEAAINGMIKAISVALQQGDKVTLSGLGTFEVRERAPRVGRNPATGETVTVNATKAPVFRAGTVLKAAVNQTEHVDA